ncbi:MAG: hypothetical protein O3A55_04365 [Bacteroidetes bacterium]|nr:hypothetical protein [Bacteroidota bacterium]
MNEKFELRLKSINNFNKEKIPIAKASLASLVLPGWGEYILTSSTEKSIYPISAELSLWALYLGCNYYGNWKYNDAVLYSAAHANVDTKGKDANYFTIIGNYESIDDYNAEQLQNRQIEILPQSHYWKWNSSAEREKFRSIRVSSSEALDKLKFIATGIVLNHVISAIHSRYLSTILQSQNFEFKLSNTLFNKRAFVFNYSISLP